MRHRDPKRHDPGAPIVVSAYDFRASLYEHVNRFPRAQRTLLGRLILDEVLRMLAALTLANRLADRCEPLAEASGRLDALRIVLRLAKRLAYLLSRGYARLAETIDEIGRMLGGWLKHERARGAAAASEPGSEPEEATPRPGASGAEGKRRARRQDGVRFTMRSPFIERYRVVRESGKTCRSSRFPSVLAGSGARRDPATRCGPSRVIPNSHGLRQPG